MYNPFGPMRWERVEYQFTDVELELLEVSQATRVVGFSGIFRFHLFEPRIDGLR